MRNTQAAAGSASYLMLLLAAAGLGCDVHPSSSSRGESGSVMSLASALQGAVSVCADAAAQCEAKGADASDARAICRAGFESCRDAAKNAAKPDIDKAVHPCVDAFKGCRDDGSADKPASPISRGRAATLACLRSRVSLTRVRPKMRAAREIARPAKRRARPV